LQALKRVVAFPEQLDVVEGDGRGTLVELTKRVVLLLNIPRILGLWLSDVVDVLVPELSALAVDTTLLERILVRLDDSCTGLLGVRTVTGVLSANVVKVGLCRVS